MSMCLQENDAYEFVLTSNIPSSDLDGLLSLTTSGVCRELNTGVSICRSPLDIVT